jgi:hypothetical protein
MAVALPPSSTRLSIYISSNVLGPAICVPVSFIFFYPRIQKFTVLGTMAMPVSRFTSARNTANFRVLNAAPAQLGGGNDVKDAQALRARLFSANRPPPSKDIAKPKKSFYKELPLPSYESIPISRFTSTTTASPPLPPLPLLPTGNFDLLQYLCLAYHNPCFIIC